MSTTHNFSQIEDSDVIGGQSLTIQQCLNLIIQGKPLPAAALRQGVPQYRKDILVNNKVHDELYEIEIGRRNIEYLAHDVELLKQQAAAAQRAQQASAASEASNASSSGEAQ